MRLFIGPELLKKRKDMVEVLYLQRRILIIGAYLEDSLSSHRAAPGSISRIVLPDATIDPFWSTTRTFTLARKGHKLSDSPVNIRISDSG